MIWVNCSNKMSNSLEKKCNFWKFLTVFPLFMPKSESLLSLLAQLLFFKERWKRFTLLALYKRATMRESLMTKERWEQFALFHEWIPLSLTKNERFAPKTDEQIPNPAKIMRKLQKLSTIVSIKTFLETHLLCTTIQYTDVQYFLFVQ